MIFGWLGEQNQGGGGPTATTIQGNSLLTQAGNPGAAIGVLPSVLVTDGSGTPVSGVTVTFTVTTGGGSAIGTTQVTDANGIATVGGWTLGGTRGDNELQATSTGLTGSPVIFICNTLAAQIGGGGSPSHVGYRRWREAPLEGEPKAVAPKKAEPPKPKRKRRPGKPVPAPVQTVVPSFPEPPAIPPVAALSPILSVPVPAPKPPAPEPIPEPPPPPPKPDSTRVVLVTKHWGGLGLAMQMQAEGSEVICAYDYSEVDPEELEATQKIGDGLVQKMPLSQAMQAFDEPSVLWLFDANDLADHAETLKARGALVLGTSALAAKLEDDREFATDTAKALGFDLPLTEEFTDYAAATAFLEEHGEQSFVYKPDQQDPTATYVPLNPETGNEEVRRYLDTLEGTGSPKFILQEQVQGVEVNLELWLHEGKPLLALCDLESKRRLTGDLGDMCGCAGDYVFVVPIDHPVVRDTVGRYLNWPALANYTGSIDANVILAGDQNYFLENCFRFGYNAYPTLTRGLVQAPLEQVFRAWVTGQPVSQYFDSGIAGSLSLMMAHPRMGAPLIVPPEMERDVYLYRAYKDGDGLQMVDHWDELCCVVSTGDSIEEAGALNLLKAEKIGFPNKGYRTDLADATLSTLPASRYQELAAIGFRAGLVPAEVA